MFKVSFEGQYYVMFGFLRGQCSYMKGTIILYIVITVNKESVKNVCFGNDWQLCNCDETAVCKKLKIATGQFFGSLNTKPE